jgi:hypothetical protein
VITRLYWAIGNIPRRTRAKWLYAVGVAVFLVLLILSGLTTGGGVS